MPSASKQRIPLLPIAVIASLGVAAWLIAGSNSPPETRNTSQDSETDADTGTRSKITDLGASSRCGCKLTEATNFGQPEGCRLAKRPNLVGLNGYLKATPVPADLPQAPWRVTEVKQTGPKTWDPVPGLHTARTKVRVIQAEFLSEFSPLKGRLQVSEAGSSDAKPFWIGIEDFDPVAWWSCPVEKAVVHSMIIAQAHPDSRPTTIEGRWIETSYTKPLWCYTWVRDVGVYCLPTMSKRTSSFDPWIYKPDDVTIVY